MVHGAWDSKLDELSVGDNALLRARRKETIMRLEDLASRITI